MMSKLSNMMSKLSNMMSKLACPSDVRDLNVLDFVFKKLVANDATLSTI